MTSDRLRTTATRSAAVATAALLVALGTAAPALAQDASPTPDPAAAAAPAAEAATNNNRFSLSASADGEAFEIQNSKIPANIVVAAAPISSFAQLDSAGQSRAYAGFPYFGPSVQSLPSTVNGLSGGLTPPIPSLPGYVESRFPSEPKLNESQGTYTLKAESSDQKSAGAASAGVAGNPDDPQPQSYSTALTEAKADGSVVSYATAGASGLQVGPLNLLKVRSAEKITETGTGAPKIESGTDLGSFTVAGFKIGITDKGFELLGSVIPLPAADALKAVTNALAASNIQVEYLPRKVVKDTVNDVTTVTSGSLRITTLQDVPIQGPTKVIYTYAKVAVSSSNVAETAVDDAGTGTDTSGGGDTASTTGGDTGVAGALALDPGSEVPPATDDGAGVLPDVAAPDTSGDVPLDAGSAPADTSGTDASAGGAPVVAGDGTEAQQPVVSLGGIPRSAERGDGTLIYLVLVFGGAATFVSQQLFSRFGVRLLMRA
ncbi:MAG: hypothetical protein JWM64_1174 [Frankiales bacterium]|nr:hypothetical protein [Frankiales bacterium]